MASKKVSARGATKKVAVEQTTERVPASGPSTEDSSRLQASPRASASAADAIDEQLARYRSMRNFEVTAEPSGSANESSNPSASLPFCIQKHAASHLHYDFRLGWNGVLKSWACAKGPSYDVRDKRLAVQVEDHPIEYGGFEGIIPAGQYGGGTVMLWDQGTWQPQEGYDDVDSGLRDGHLKFVLHGTKMRGKWALIRMGGNAAQEKKPNWLLIKEHDQFETSDGAEAVTDSEPRSVVTDRSMEEIASSKDHIWNSKETARGSAWHRQEPELKSTKAGDPLKGSNGAPSPGKQNISTADNKGAKKRAGDALSSLPEELQPSFVKPQLAQETTAPPEGDNWLHELKLDGYRIQARKQGGNVQMLTRSGLDWTHRIPAVAQSVSRLEAENVTLDGEVVVLAADGTTNFADLQASFQDGAKNPLTYFCFDLLHLDGRNPRKLPLLERKQLLAGVLESADGDVVRLSEHLRSGGDEIFHKACELHAEGIVSKRAQGAYIEGRNAEWLKSKCLHEQEFVIGGYALPSNGSHSIGSLLLGYYRGGHLIYAGRAGTGFTQKVRRSLRENLDRIPRSAMPFQRMPAEAKRGAVWAEPKFVAQIRFASWTAEDLVRQAAFLGLREDKKPSDVRREDAKAPPRPKGSKTRAVGDPVPFHPRKEDRAEDTRSKVKVTAGGERADEKLPASGGHARTATPLGSGRPPVRLTHPAKVLDRVSGVTKQTLADFYWTVASRMLPHIADRPLSLVRCPEGSEKPCFYQKHVSHMLPAGVTAVNVPDKKTGVPEPYITLNTPEALAGLAQMGVLEVHPWGSRNADLEHADRLIFDLDPDETLSWIQVTAAAQQVHDRLRDIGLKSFLKTTGGKGLHIVVPVVASMEWPAIKDWAHFFVVAMEHENPGLYLTKMTKAARAGKIYLDYLRNERGATAVAPYSPRARSGMGVSLPLAWSELRSQERPSFQVGNFEQWRDRLKTDPWHDIDSTRQTIRPIA